MHRILVIALLLAPALPASAQEPASPPPSDAELFTAAGFAEAQGRWSKCGDPGTASYAPGAIDQRGDFNGDGQPDALISEGSAYCFGQAETGYTLVSREADGGWLIVDERAGFASFRETSGSDGWPDISVGGPGFCFPVLRWNGTAYVQHRLEYQGEPCTMRSN